MGRASIPCPGVGATLRVRAPRTRPARADPLSAQRRLPERFAWPAAKYPQSAPPLPVYETALTDANFQFVHWVNSNGTTASDWYQTGVAGAVFPAQ